MTPTTHASRVPGTASAAGHPSIADARDGIRQLTLRGILGTWAAAALPMGILSWLVSPWLAHHMSGPGTLSRALILTLTAGLVWQGLLVTGLVYREQRSLRWSVVKRALWLRRPTSPKSGRTGGRLWWVVLPLVVAFGAEELVPSLPIPVSRDLGLYLGSHAGRTFLSGNWLWFALMVVMLVFNTVLGEELLFRGFLLPRMQGVFGRHDWVANGVLFATYHLHMPWAIAPSLLDTFILAGPSRRYRSALIGIAVHSAQSVVLFAVILAVVLT